MCVRALLLLSVLVLSRVSGAAGNSAIDRATLKGLKACSVVVDPPDPELERAGITRDWLEARIKDRLQGAGVPADPKAIEFLGLRIRSARAKRAPYAVSVELGLYQPVVLVRDREIRTATETWAAESVLLVDRRLLVRSSTLAVDQLVDEFIDALRSSRSR